jgi:MFS transporter, DHA1 family, tetracycline resistance protein
MKNTTSVQDPARTGRSPLVIIFITVFIDLVGFGIIIPLSPYLAREFNASPLEIGFLLSIFSIFQFLFSPFWGALSDRIGRRPVLLISLLGAGLSYLLFAFGTTFEVLLIARGLAGLFGGNISTAHAYIADVTSPEERSKGMGLIGAAFGLGFVIGPLLGGLFGALGEWLGSAPPLGLSFSAVGAAAICLGNFAFAYFVLPESLPASRRGAARSKRHRLREISDQLRRPVVGRLVFVFFLSGLAMAQMEAMLFPYVADVFGWDLRTASYGFAYVGVLMVITQGYLIRKWMPRFGEKIILTTGLGLFALSLFGIGVSTTIAAMAVTMTVLAVGNGMMRPPNLGIISLMTPAEEQGSVMGVTNSLASLGRIIGPVIGGVLYQHFSRGAPFLFAGILAACSLILVLTSYPQLPNSGKTSA